MAQHIPLRHDTPYRKHPTAYHRHFWTKTKADMVEVGDTIVAAAGLGMVKLVEEYDGLIVFTVTGRNGNSRASGSPLTYYKGQDIYLHEDKRCKCKEEDDD